MMENYYYVHLSNGLSAEIIEESVVLHYPLSAGFILFELH